jgi:hypothetical protein
MSEVRRHIVARPVTLAVSLATAFLFMLAPVALADEPTNGRVLVQADHVMPGESAPLAGADLDEGPIVLVLKVPSRAEHVGEGVVAPDGSLQATLAVPADFPVGHATLEVVGAAGTWSTTVLIGPRAEGPGGETGRSPGPIDERAIALGVMAIGGLIFVVALARYRRRGRGVSSDAP